MKEEMKEEEREVKVILLPHCKDDEESSDEMGYVSDSEAYLLLAPDSDHPYSCR